MASVGNALPIHQRFPFEGAKSEPPAAFSYPSGPALRHFLPPVEGVLKPFESGQMGCSGRNPSIQGGADCPKNRFFWQGLVGLVLGVGLLGCRTNSQIALLELENRLLEDRIYQLEAQLAKQAQQLAACQQQMGVQVPAESRPVIPSSKGPIPSSSTSGSGLPAISGSAPGPGISPSPSYPSEAGGRNAQNSGVSPVDISLPHQSLPAGQMPKIFSLPGGQPAEQPLPTPGPQLNNPAPLGNASATLGNTSASPENTPGSLGNSSATPGNPPATDPANASAPASGNPPTPPTNSPSSGDRKGEDRPSSGSPAGGNISSQGRRPSSLSVGLSPAAVPGSAGAFASSGWRVGDWSSRVQQIQIIPALTGPYNSDGQPGDEGITVGLQPVDGQGGLVPAAAPISLVVIDPAISDDSARVARWDFSAEEIAGFTHQLPQGQPLRLVLVWPNGPPRHNRLHLFVRYMTADGRKLQADMPLQVDVEGRQIALLSRGGAVGRDSPQPPDGSASSAPEPLSSAAPFGQMPVGTHSWGSSVSGQLSSPAPFGQTPLAGARSISSMPGQPPGGNSGGAGSVNFHPPGPSGGGSVSGGAAPFRASSPTEGLGSDQAVAPSPIMPTTTLIPEFQRRRPRIPWQPTR